jgi:hypothetical protein
MFTLRYFMWQWQHIFQRSAANLAQRFLEPLDPHLAPDAFLVGFLVAENAEGIEPICVSPEDCCFRPEAFADVPQLMEELAKADPQFSWRCSAPSDPDTYQHMAVRRGLRCAVEQTLGQADSGAAFFASEPAFVNGYSVLVVVRIDRPRYETHYRLKHEFVEKVQMRYSVGRSLIETTIRALLDALAEKLQQPDPGRNILLIRDYSTVYRAAAEQLMRGPAWAGGDMMGLPAIYDICNTISLQNYEGAEGAGCVVFGREDHPSIKIELKL